MRSPSPVFALSVLMLVPFFAAQAEVAPTPSPDTGGMVQQDSSVETKTTVEAYVRKLLAPQSTLTILNWSDFSESGETSRITLTYRVRQPFREDVEASVRFFLERERVVKTEISRSSETPTPTPPPRVVDHFSESLADAKHAGNLTLHLENAFSLADLDAAKAKAKAEKKPLGFLMVWGDYFNKLTSTRERGSVSALAHFYRAFNDRLILVFVRHETELASVPDAVKSGFNGPDEGGFAPNMAVTDATASEFIVEIPFQAKDATGRDELFATGAKKIDLWLSTHPDAAALPPPVQAP